MKLEQMIELEPSSVAAVLLWLVYKGAYSVAARVIRERKTPLRGQELVWIFMLIFGVALGLTATDIANLADDRLQSIAKLALNAGFLAAGIGMIQAGAEQTPRHSPIIQP